MIMHMKKIKIAFLAVLVFYINRFYAQTDSSLNYGTPVTVTQGMPVSWAYLDTNYTYTDTSAIFNPVSSSNFRTTFGKYTLPYHSNAALQRYADSVQGSCSTCGSGKYYGYGIEGSINLKSSAQYYNPSIAGGKLWILHMNSQTALGLQFYFSKFMIPTNSFMHIYTADRTRLLGPYTSDNSPVDSTLAIHFGTIPIFANDVYIEYYESDSASYTGTIKFANVIHLFTTSLGGAADCQQDVACAQSSWGSAVASTALILIYKQTNTNNDTVNLAGTCSGNLLNDTKNDEKPYFLTAGHCLYSPAGNLVYSPTTWNFIFDYQKACCNDTSHPEFTKVVYGADVLSADTLQSCPSDDNEYGKSDYLLLLLNPPPLLSFADWGVCFAGWETKDPTTASGFTEADVFTLIHHPQGDVMKISEGNNLLHPTAAKNDLPGCPTDNTHTLVWPNDYFYNVDFGESNNGAPEKGSSGAGLFDSQGRIVGTYTGADDDDIQACQSNTTQYHDSANVKPDHYYFGRFSKQFPNFLQEVNGKKVNFLDSTGEVDGTTFTGVASHCSSNGAPGIKTCTANGNNNGNGGVPCGVPQGINQGININGLAGLPVLCPTNNITITGLTTCHDIYLTAPYKQHTSCNFYDDGHCNGCNNAAAFAFTHCGGLSGTCHSSICDWFYSSYVIQIGEMDENLNPVGSQKTKLFTIPAWMADVYEGTSFTSQTIFGFSNFSFQVNDISAGYSLQPGHFYQVGIGSSNEPAEWGTYQNASRLIYIMPGSYPSDAYTSGLTTIGDSTYLWDNRDIYATNDIVLNNKKVLTDINEVTAGDSIVIQGTASGYSDLQGGHYFTSPVACNTSHAARMANTNPSPPARGNNTYAAPAKSTYIQNTITTGQNAKAIAPGFSLYPNPANDNIIAEFTGTLPKGNGPVTVSIYNSIGQLVQNESLSSFQHYINLNVGMLTTGMYNIIISQSGKSWQSKIIKQ
jgi:hypothetical protein